EAEELESLEEAEPLAAGAEEAEELESLEEAGDVAAGAEEPEELESLEDAGDANQSPKKSNLRLVFGDDDIPTIVETSGLELVDEDVDSVLNTMRSDEEVGELEDLEGEDLEDEPGKDESPAPARAPRDVLADLASEIEFSAPKEPETGEEIDNRQVEIVSPFATMLSDFNPIQDGDSPAETSRKKKPRKILSKLEELDAGYPMALVYKPFSGQETVNAELNGTPETGEPEKNVEPGPPDTVIEERDGIHYVNENILNPSKETEKKLDPDFKNLINSVLKK
ncbi:MAG: hypothetical protein LBP32_04695, partial [Spirochaetaceae bacterium]|nr:hypothetical protein [Spirochaetaceae bacterium]